MTFKLLLALAVAITGWWLWQGPKKVHTSGKRPQGPPPPVPQPADQLAALTLLGLDARASDADIRAAHRRLLLAVHPDHGGSSDLAQRVNAARDTLLKRQD
ncbi:J domain-containing protein [Sphingomonas bacterium]|uniref:J domain-containing protein n=1 Tax=Sphingomonas bacterium TaxID=1895847 RepID=UPI00260E59ED|nr:J domain-containing protein [Sphingomonas bacterium]MDB5678229.1 molecular chaperone DnaJ [Sphingomonas bacterium]